MASADNQKGNEGEILTYVNSFGMAGKVQMTNEHLGGKKFDKALEKNGRN